MPNPIRQQMVKGLKKGDQFVFKRTFTQKETQLFGDLTQDYNPVHYDTRWTDAKKMNGLICHGLLVGSMICEFGGQVGWLASGMTFKFMRPVYFDDTIQCSITLTKTEDNGRAEAQAIFTNQTDEQIGHAKLTGRLPLENEKQILEQMMKEGDPSNRLSEKSYRQIAPPANTSEQNKPETE